MSHSSASGRRLRLRSRRANSRISPPRARLRRRLRRRSRPAAARRHQASGLAHVEAPLHAPDQVAHLTQLAALELGEVLAAQRLGVAPGEDELRARLLAVGFGVLPFPAAAALDAPFDPPAHPLDQHAEVHLGELGGVARDEEEIERGAEPLEVLAPRHQHRLRGVPEVAAAADVDQTGRRRPNPRCAWW